MAKTADLISLIRKAFDSEIIRKIVFSRPIAGEAVKASARLCAHRGRKLLAIEYSFPSGTVSQENISDGELEVKLSELILNHKQVNLLTALGDVEYKISKKGKEALLGAEALKGRLSGDRPKFEAAIEALDKEKSYLLGGDEDFLIALGISDKSGRVHDKKQAKFRQINRFLEHIEDIYERLPSDGRLTVYDLCCGKSYLSFAVYYYLTAVKEREVFLLGIDLKADVIDWCRQTKDRLSYRGMRFVCDDIRNTPADLSPDMVISLHACDIATDIVINRAIELHAPIILSTPCCHRYLNGKITSSELSFVTKYPHLQNKLAETLTDAIRAARLEANGYSVSVLELTDPENTPKNTLIRAILTKRDENLLTRKGAEYDSLLKFVLGEGYDNYLKEIK